MEAIELIDLLKSEGYFSIRLIPGRGLCGLHRLLFTTGIVYSLDEHSYKGRYCYESPVDAALALQLWDGIGDPPGPWIVNKGEPGGDRRRVEPIPQEEWDKINPQPWKQ